MPLTRTGYVDSRMRTSRRLDIIVSLASGLERYSFDLDGYDHVTSAEHCSVK